MSWLCLFVFVWFALLITSNDANKVINGIDCVSIHELFGSAVVADSSVINIYFGNGFSDYFVSVNNETWLQSGDTQVRNDNEWAELELSTTQNHSGYDAFGKYNELTLIYKDTDAMQFATHFRYYPESPDILLFTQTFPNGANSTSTSNPNSIISSFPSFRAQTVDQSLSLGFAHFGGFMASSEYPQFGEWSNSGVSKLGGGIQETGPLAIFDSDFANTLVISALTDHMASMDNKSALSSDATSMQYRFGLQGNITSIPAKYTISFVLKLSRNGGGVNRAMKEWGETQLRYYGVKEIGNAHDRDYTLQYLGYSTDNGAYYYYNTETGKNYQDTLLDLKAYHDSAGLPTKWILLDSWWYYKGQNGGLKNWTARTDVFPNGMAYIYEQTNWKIQAHNRYFAPDNVYASNPGNPGNANNNKTFPFTWGNNLGLPISSEFWDYFLGINQDWGLVNYEQDWLSQTEDNCFLVLNTTSFGKQWLTQMSKACYANDVSIQYCMSYPRHVMTSVGLMAVTQARASDDYHPGNDQWKLGVSSIFTSSIDIAPSKDSFWSQPGYQAGPYSNTTEEPYNRLQALVLSLTNGPWTFADQIGHSDVDLIMKCCNSDGLVLRPDVSATEIDRYFLEKAGLDKSSLPLNGELWTTTSVIANSEYYRYYYVFGAVLQNDFSFIPSDLDHYIDSRNGNVINNWIAFETNTTDQYTIFNETNAIDFKKCTSKYDFQYYSLIPLLPGDYGWYLQGEVDKWISVSRQMFVSITNDNSGSVNVKIVGVPMEIINVAFVKYPELIQQIVSCTIDETGSAVIRMPAATCMPY